MYTNENSSLSDQRAQERAEEQYYGEAMRETMRVPPAGASRQQHHQLQQQQHLRRAAPPMAGQRNGSRIAIYEDPVPDSNDQSQRRRQDMSQRAIDPQRQAQRPSTREPPGAPNVQERKRQIAQQEELAARHKKPREAAPPGGGSGAAVAAARPLSSTSLAHGSRNEANRQQQPLKQQQHPQQQENQQHQHQQQQQQQQKSQKKQQQQQQQKQPEPAADAEDDIEGVDVPEDPPRFCVIRYRNGKMVEQLHVALKHHNGTYTPLDGRMFFPEGVITHDDGTMIRTWCQIDGRVYHEISVPPSITIRAWMSADGVVHHDVRPVELPTGKEGAAAAAAAANKPGHEKRSMRFVVEQGMRRQLTDKAIYRKLVQQIEYGSYYEDDLYQYRHVILPKALMARVDRCFFDAEQPHLLRLLEEQEWRKLGLSMSYGWENYMRHEPEPHVMLFRRRKPISQYEKRSNGSAAAATAGSGSGPEGATTTKAMQRQDATKPQGNIAVSAVPEASYEQEHPSPVPTKQSGTPPSHH
ncbi:hypothetical protein BGZ73_001785 [Actinomortierella ambigua]|nr:hypothetical protein BGZ73_001785 [Actinomortierella ambigua]